jgi:hypothetical protein
MQSIGNKILKRVHGNGLGWVFVATDFLDLGNRAAVDQALSRLARDGVIRRLRRGMYDYPRRHPLLGQLSPTPDDIARTMARKAGQSVQASGAQAANMLGLSTQVPARPVYVTDGPSRAVRIGSQTVRFRHARRFAGAGRPSRTVFLALSHIGKDRVTEDVISQLRANLSLKDKRALMRDVRYATTWMQPVIARVAQTS